MFTQKLSLYFIFNKTGGLILLFIKNVSIC